MSQVSGLAGNGGAGRVEKPTTGRAVLLLAVAVVLFVALLQQLEKEPGTPSSKPQDKAQPAASATTVTTVPVRSPAEVKVLVANGAATAGAATRVNSRLQPVGYRLGKPTNTATKASASSIAYQVGYQAEAQAVATTLGLPATAVVAMPAPLPVADLQDANILVIVGPDLAAASSASTSTTTGANGSAATTTTGMARASGGVTTTIVASGSTATTANPATNGPLNQLTTTTVAGAAHG